MTAPFRVRGKEIQVLRSNGWRTLKGYDSRKTAIKHLMGLLRSHAEEHSPPPVSSLQGKEDLPVAEARGVTNTPETPVTTTVGPRGPRAWHPVAEKYWVGLDAEFRPWVTWLV
jgi:hypothetical protein